MKGKFTQFSGTLDLDREHPARSNVAATIQVRSIDTAIAKRDEHLRSAEFFNVAKYPEITFQSKSVKQTGTDTGDIVGELAMHGVKKEITLHVKFLGLKGAGAAQRSRWHVTAEPIKRSEFGLLFSKTLESVSMIGDTVTATMEIEAVKAKLDVCVWRTSERPALSSPGSAPVAGAFASGGCIGCQRVRKRC